MNYKTGKILQLMKKWELFKQQKFTEKDIRGLSKREKDFIRANEYNVVYFQKTTYKHMDKIVLFIDKDMVTGKKRLYGQTKWRMMLPNGEFDDAAPQSAGNPTRIVYDRWLIPRLDNVGTKWEVFNYYWFEQRFCTVPHFPYPYALFY